MDTSTTAINNAGNAALGIIQQAGVPLVTLFLILFVSWFGIAVMWNQLVNVIKRIAHYISDKRF